MSLMGQGSAHVNRSNDSGADAPPLTTMAGHRPSRASGKGPVPQQAFDDQYNPITFTVVVRLEEARNVTVLSLKTENAGGRILAAASVILPNQAAAELLPEAMRMAAFGWLCAGPREMVQDVAQFLRSRIRQQAAAQGLS
jgi:hypothetical protein